MTIELGTAGNNLNDFILNFDDHSTVKYIGNNESMATKSCCLTFFSQKLFMHNLDYVGRYLIQFS